MAYDYRQRFHRDVVIDMLCYRKHGHNEGDDASYTQPVLYRKLKEHKSVAALYAARLIKDGVVTARGSHRRAGSAEEVSLRYLRSDAEEQGRVGAAGDESHRSGFDAAGSAAHGRELVGAGTGDPDASRSSPAASQLHPKLVRMVEKRAAALRENSDRLGAGGDAGLRQLDAGRNVGAFERAGRGTRHVQPAPRRVSRLRNRRGLRAVGAVGAGPGEVRSLQQPAERIRGDGFRIRL